MTEQLTMENGLFQKEKEQLRLLDALSRLARQSAYITTITTASAGNYKEGTKQHKHMAQAATSLHYANYWIAMMRHVVAKGIKGYKGHTVEKYLGLDKEPYSYSLDTVKQPFAVYEAYVRLLNSTTLTIKQNQKAVDSTTKGNVLVGCLFDSLQDTGEQLEKII